MMDGKVFVLRYRADIRSLTFVGVYFGLLGLQWVWAPRSAWLAGPLLAATCVASFIGAVITHNTVHCPVFRERWQNRIFQVVLSLTYGHPVSAYVPGHNLSHHKHTQSRRDVMRTSKVRFRWNVLNLLTFALRVGPDIMRGDAAYVKAMRGTHRAWYRQYYVEAGVLLVVSAVLIWLSWQKFLLYWLLPHMYAGWGIITMNLLQHDGTDPESPYNHSRNFVGRALNWVTLNNGYHGIHHMHPGLHWSLLPAAHARELAPHQDPRLDEPSLVRYVWRTFVVPARRLRYDGTPVVLPKEGPDERWIPAPKDVSADLGAINAA
jgi:fatty acid desaturase